MQISNFIKILNNLAPSYYQESYDNTGLLTGDASAVCTGILCTLDVTEQVLDEALQKKCNLIVAHHPIIFSGLKKITGKSYVERTVIKAIKSDIAIYAIHTNLDNILDGVNKMMADKLGLVNRKVLLPKANTILKLAVFVPSSHTGRVKQAMFDAGGGNIGQYSGCSFSSKGIGTFTPGTNTNPYIGNANNPEIVEEDKIEIIFPVYAKDAVLTAMKNAHPYEEVAYDIYSLVNEYDYAGSGLIGEMQNEIEATELLSIIKHQFNLKVIRHTPLLDKKVKKIALCGGAGSFLIKHAVGAGADFYITGDVKYHEFFDAENKLVIADIGHYESEQFTVDLLYDILHVKFPTFAVLKSKVITNPVNYFA